MSASREPVERRVDRGLPLALSARRGDKYYDPAAARLSGLIEVLLDGDSLDHVTSYDVPAGIVVRERRDWRGRVIIADDGCPALEALSGRVEVRWRRDGSARI